LVIAFLNVAALPNFASSHWKPLQNKIRGRMYDVSVLAAFL
jgi:hypothetical protein